jgi:UDP-N-acetylglucosamine 4-epimerase
MNLLLTGGAGFIGSHILEAAINDTRIEKISVLDNLSSGFIRNIEPFLDNAKVEFVEGDIRNRETCAEVMKGITAVCHQAAMGSVPRSIKSPDLTHDNNVTGFINIATAARDEGVKRMVYATSSSTYGDANYQPKVESRIGRPLSPYAVSKLANELYAEVFSKNYGMTIAGFRYFNVFGPRQDPNGAYAAVIPLFFKHALEGTSPTINGDGSITRDYTYVGNVVKANINALFADTWQGNEVFNIACGTTTNLNVLWHQIKTITGSSAEAIHGPDRTGDILHSLADISKVARLLDYNNLIDLSHGLTLALNWYRSQLTRHGGQGVNC